MNAAELYEQIGRLKVEVEFLKKKLPSSAADKRLWIEPGHGELERRRAVRTLGPASGIAVTMPLSIPI